jgi:signal transduction histidine kinase
MKKLLDHYLQRASIAAQRDSVVSRTPVGATLERMARVVRKLNPDTSVRLSTSPQEVLFAGEQEDLEEIVGNLVENAVKWAKSTVSLSVAAAGEGGEPMFALLVEDDGPGIPADKAREALKRGSRLDESKPGTGLGLAIVADLVKEYGGRLALERSTLGGLKAVVELKRAQ